MVTAWRGALVFSDRVFAYLGAVGTTDRHAHHAAQLAIALDAGWLELEDDRGDRRAAAAFVIPADAPHAITAACPRALLIYVDPESDLGATVARGTGVAAWSDAGAALPGVELAAEAGEPALSAAVATLLAPRTALERPLHPAIHRAVALLPRLVGAGEVRVAHVARAVGVSESRLMHLFRAQVGVPLRPYVRWLRLRLAADEVRRGANLTEAAHAAGFADSAHLSNAFRAAFGLTPSELVRGLRWVE